MMHDFRKDLLNTALNAGLEIISLERCAELLVFLATAGSTLEAAVFDKKLNAHIVYAQERFAIFPGVSPKPEAISLFKEKWDDLKSHVVQGDIPEWVQRLADDYALPRYSYAVANFTFV